MDINRLKRRIESQEARVAVIGLGYVGLPVAASFARAGFDVLGVDILEERIKVINSGKSPIEGNEPGLQDLISSVINNKQLRASNNYEDLRDREIILIDVDTPVGEDHKPRYEALQSCLKQLGPVLGDGALVVVESTISPGTMDRLVRPHLEENSGKRVNVDFLLGNCPERVMPGKLLHNLTTLSRVVGGMTKETADLMVAFYQNVVNGELDPTDCVTAELVKTTENAYRDVQIAFANEVALICEAVGGDVWKVRELVNKSPGRNMLMPGAGVGGHCIPKDPWLLAHGVDGKGLDLKIIPAARKVNDSMPEHMANILDKALSAAGKTLKGSRILVMGYAYLEDSDDTRNSPSSSLVNLLTIRGASVVVHDPYVDAYKDDLMGKAKNSDAAVLMVKHAEYASLDLDRLASQMNSKIMCDGRGLYAESDHRHSFAYYSMGVMKKSRLSPNVSL